MKRYTAEDITILDDPTPVIRRLYAQQKLGGRQLAERLMGELILLGALPARVDQIEGWWTISSDPDWLTQNGVLSMAPFFRIVAFPAAGDNSHRGEILLTAFANAVATWGAEGCTWVCGHADHWPVPDRLKSEADAVTHGSDRLIAFRVDEVSSAGATARA